MTDTAQTAQAAAVIPHDEQLRRYRAETKMLEAQVKKAEAEASLAHLAVYKEIMARWQDTPEGEDIETMFETAANNYFTEHFNAVAY